jgi:hypothetical protein
MTINETAAGDYVTRAHPITQVGTYTGVPARTRGTYVSGTATPDHVGRYIQSAPRKAPARTATESILVPSSLLAHH